MTTQNKILARGERNLPARAGQPLLPDEENACFAFGPRTYSPATGCFLSPDPLWESFRNANPYHYCFNNPISYKDPSGLAPEKEKSKEDELQRTEDEYEKRLREYMFLQECYRIEAAMLKALTPDWLTNGSYGTFEPFNSGISYIAVGGGPGGGDGNSGKTGSSNGIVSTTSDGITTYRMEFHNSTIYVRYNSGEINLKEIEKQTLEALDQIYNNGGGKFFSENIDYQIDYTLSAEQIADYYYNCYDVSKKAKFLVGMNCTEVAIDCKLKNDNSSYIPGCKSLFDKNWNYIAKEMIGCTWSSDFKDYHGDYLAYSANDPARHSHFYYTLTDVLSHEFAHQYYKSTCQDFGESAAFRFQYMIRQNILGKKSKYYIFGE